MKNVSGESEEGVYFIVAKESFEQISPKYGCTSHNSVTSNRTITLLVTVSKLILNLYMFLTAGNARKATSNKIGQLPDDFFSEFAEIKFLDIVGTRVNVWPNFTSAHNLIILHAFDVALKSTSAPENIGNTVVVLISTVRAGFLTTSSTSALILTIIHSFVKSSRVENSTSYNVASCRNKYPQ